MKRHAAKRWMEACLLGSILATGCSQTGSRVEDHPPWIAKPVLRPRMNQPVLAQRPVEAPPPQPVQMAQAPTMLPPVAPVAPTSLPAVAPMAVPPATPASLPAVAPMTIPTPPVEEKTTIRDAALTQAALDTSKGNGLREHPPVRKSYVDISAHPCFSHTDSYNSLSGQLQYSRLTKAWRLRYASVDEVDTYGGSVTLSDDGRLGGFKDGDYARVQGRMLNGESKGIAPPYEVESIQAISKKD